MHLGTPGKQALGPEILGTRAGAELGERGRRLQMNVSSGPADAPPARGGQEPTQSVAVRGTVPTHAPRASTAKRLSAKTSGGPGSSHPNSPRQTLWVQSEI